MGFQTGKKSKRHGDNCQRLEAPPEAQAAVYLMDAEEQQALQDASRTERSATPPPTECPEQAVLPYQPQPPLALAFQELTQQPTAHSGRHTAALYADARQQELSQQAISYHTGSHAAAPYADTRQQELARWHSLVDMPLEYQARSHPAETRQEHIQQPMWHDAGRSHLDRYHQPATPVGYEAQFQRVEQFEHTRRDLQSSVQQRTDFGGPQPQHGGARAWLDGDS